MDIIKQLSDDTFGGGIGEINSFFAYRQSQIQSSSTPSMESGVVGDFLKKIINTIQGRNVGNYTPRMITPFAPAGDWLTVGEVVIESPVTFKSATVSTFYGQLDKARPAIQALEDEIETFISTLGGYISNPAALASMSGVKEVVDGKRLEIRSLDAVKRMVDIDTSSRTKLSRLFTSVSDLKVSVDLSNGLNEVLGKVNMTYLKERVERIVELIEILEQDSKDVPSKNSLTSLSKDTHKLAVAISDLAYVITAVDHVTIMIESVKKAL